MMNIYVCVMGPEQAKLSLLFRLPMRHFGARRRISISHSVDFFISVQHNKMMLIFTLTASSVMISRQIFLALLKNYQ